MRRFLFIVRKLNSYSLSKNKKHKKKLTLTFLRSCGKHTFSAYHFLLLFQTLSEYHKLLNDNISEERFSNDHSNILFIIWKNKFIKNILFVR